MTGKQGIIYLQKDRFQMYSPFLRQIVEFRFVPEIVRDSDVINPELLENLIKVFVTNTKLPPSNLTIVLADNAYFVKDFVLPAPSPAQKNAPSQPQMSMETLQVMSMDFVEHVPYENVVSKSFPLKNGLKVCAVNKDFYDAISSSFTKLGFIIDGVYPGLVLGNNLTTKPVLDTVLVSAVFSKLGSIKQYDLLPEEVYKPAEKKNAETTVEMELETFEEKNKKPNKKRLVLMVGVLVLLLVILVVVYFQSQTPPVPPQPAAQSAAPAAPAAVSPVIASPTESPSAAPAKVSASNLSAQIINASDSTTDAQTLRESLGKFSFKTLTTSAQSNVGTSTTVVTFTTNVTQETRNAVLEEVRNIKDNITVQEIQDGEFDITIILGQ